jgi:hypothetical protein
VSIIAPNPHVYSRADLCIPVEPQHISKPKHIGQEIAGLNGLFYE